MFELWEIFSSGKFVRKLCKTRAYVRAGKKLANFAKNLIMQIESGSFRENENVWTIFAKLFAKIAIFVTTLAGSKLLLSSFY
jgi:hypothetical protein